MICQDYVHLAVCEVPSIYAKINGALADLHGPFIYKKALQVH